MTENPDKAEALREEILAEARRQGEDMVSRARYDAEVSLAGAAVEADKAGRERLDRAREEAARRRETILATVPVETGRIEAERIETLLESVREEARRRLLAHAGFEYRESLVALASHAISRMAGLAFVVKVAEEDRSILDDGAAGEIGRRTGRDGAAITISGEPGLTEGGVVVEDGEARQVWDNRLAKRLERMWPELRRYVAMEASFIPKKAAGEGGP